DGRDYGLMRRRRWWRWLLQRRRQQLFGSLISMQISRLHKTLAMSFAASLCLFPAAMLAAGAQEKPVTKYSYGLCSTTFKTSKGTIQVNLPDDGMAGDQISGSVLVEPKGTTESERARNTTALKAYIVELD